MVPTPVAAPQAVAPPAQTPVPVSEPAAAPESAKAEPVTETATGWEEPTTVQAPTWDDEPVKASKPSEPVHVEEAPAKEEPTPAPKSEPIPAPSAIPIQVQPPAVKSEVAPSSTPQKPATPAAHTRPLSAAHRHKFKADEAVVMPTGVFGGSLEKIGMQFGSLSLGGEDLDDA